MNKIWIIDEGLDRMGGVERILNTLTNHLVGQYEIELISLYKKNKEPYYTYPENVKIHYIYDYSHLFSAKHKKIRLLYLGIRFFETIIEKLTIYFQSRKLSKRITKEDIVLYGRVATALIFLPHVKETKKTIVREAIHLYYHKNPEKIKKYFPNKVDCFIVSSEENIKIYQDFLGDKVNVVKIYNPLGIIPQPLDSLDNKVVVSTGRYDTHKGYDYLIRAFKTVVNKHPDWVLNIVGDGYYKPNMESLIKQLELSNNVNLVPSTKDIVSELKKASIYVMASRFEGYANSLVEAMVCGVPSISYNWLVGADEIIKDGENGKLVYLQDRFQYFKTLDINPMDVENLGNAINEFIENRELREKYSQNGMKLRETRDTDKIINTWLNYILKDVKDETEN